MAYGIARSAPATRGLLLLLIVLPFWISFLLRVYAWMGLMNNYGVINNLLMWLGIIEQPLQLMYTDFAIFIGLAYSYLPFMILPLYATLERMDIDLIEAAQDLGASRTRAFWDITWPLAKPGVIAGCLLVFIPAMGEYVIPYLLGGPESLLIGRVLFDEFFVNRDWPLASAVAIVLLLLLVVPIVLLQRYQAKDETGTT
jgi:putrescine transport system permease protein